MDGRFQPRPVTPRPGRTIPIERDGNLVTLRFDLRPSASRAPTTAWYHAEAVKESADRPAH